MFNNRLNQENFTPTELEKILADAGLEAEPGAVNLYIIDKLTYASNITNSTIVQGNRAETIDVGNGKAADTGSGDKWAAELLRLYKALDVKKRTQLLSRAYQLEEQAEREQQEQQSDHEQECRV